MCGIAGIVSFGGKPIFEQELRDMCAAMLHRGPDDEGIYLGTQAGLAMRRLSIIDLVSGRQPLSNEDGSLWVVLNGEIYNFADLRQRLETRGHVFRTRTDTEVILHLYEEYGHQCVDYLRGMFGFALWDERKQQLLLARDRLGIKPLYYVQIGGRILFASELKSILQLAEVDRKLNWTEVAQVFTFLSSSRTGSIIQNIHKLEPAHLLIATADRDLVIRRYWNLSFEPDYSKPAHYYISRLRDLLEESVRLHLVSDVPLGAFLSGGIDSSAVTATASGFLHEPLKTFSIGFREPEYNELDQARLVAGKCGTDHRDLTLGPDAFDDLEALAWQLDEPFGDSSAIPTYLLSKLASQSVKVVLSGDGGDELFAGYDKYLVEGRERNARFLPGLVRAALGKFGRAVPEGVRGRNYLQHFSLSGARRQLDASTLFRETQLQSLFQPEFAELLAHHEPWRERASFLESRQGHWLSNLQALDIQYYLPLDILAKVDRMSMAHSIEARVPLLDHKLVEFAATIPPEMNLRRGTTKWVFKQAMRGILPDSILDRPKRGFAVPLSYWFRGPLEAQVRDLLLGERTKQRGLFNTAYLEKLLAMHHRRKHLDLHLWTLISFELWSRSFLDPPRPKQGRVAA